MTRTTSQGGGFKGEDDKLYAASIKSAVIVKSDNPKYPDDQLKLTLLNGGSDEVVDYLSIKLGIRADGSVSKLRQLLNALAEKERDAEVWFDKDTLEWGYDMREGTAAYGALTLPGLAVSFKGENRKNAKGSYYKITGYRSAK
jgi:hypothetical protein